MVMKQIIDQLIINSILLSIAFGFVYAIYKSFKLKFAESRLSNRSIKGWKTRKATQKVVTVKILVRHIPVNINGRNAGEITLRKAI